MPRSVRAMIALVTVAGASMVVAAALADPADTGLQALAQHRPITAETLVLASAMTLGIAIGRRKSDATGFFKVVTSALILVDPDRARAHQTEARNEARNEAMTRAETEFLANMSHELRTPLNTVIGFAELVLSEIHGPLGDRRYFDYTGHIRKSGERLLAIIDATLDLSQLAAGQFDLEPCRVEPQDMVEECARLVAAQAAAAKIDLVVRPSTAPSIMADAARLKQALINVLSNAIKFTAPGGQVSIGVTGHGDVVAFEVADTGIGMTPDQVEGALQPFRMIENYMTRRQSGIGLGLPLAERLVRLHGGELRIDSRPGRGTAVTAILPTICDAP